MKFSIVFLILRLTIATVVDVLIDHISTRKLSNEASHLLKTAEDFITNQHNGESLQKYVVRNVAAKYQVGAIVEWKKRGVFLDLMPEELKNSSTNESPDMFLLIDPNYKAFRDALRLAWLSDDYEAVSNLIQAFRNEHIVWSLAFHHLTKISPANCKDRAKFEALLDQHSWLSDIWKDNQLLPYPDLVGQSHRHTAISNLIFHFKETLSRGNIPPFLNIFQQLTTNTRNARGLFLPTMPHDDTFEARQAVRDASRWYTCSKGHIYAIGDCGQPMQQAKCDTCGEVIGGQGHRFAAGAGHGAGVAVDQTQPGHILGAPVAGTSSRTVRDTGGLEVAIIRFLLHSSLYHAAQLNPADVASITFPPNPPGSLKDFFAEHLLLNLTQIANGLGKGEDDAIVLLHQVIVGLKGGAGDRGDWRLSTKATVKPWENEFAQTCIRPVLARLETDLGRHTDAVKQDKEEATSVLQDILFEKKPDVCDRKRILDLPQLWTPREAITVEGIKAKIGQDKMKTNCPFFNKIFEEETIFRELKRLPSLLELARFVVKNYNRRPEVRDADSVTIETFLSRMDENSRDREVVGPLVDAFLLTLGNLKNDLYN